MLLAYSLRNRCPPQDGSNVLRLKRQFKPTKKREDLMNSAAVLKGRHAVVFGAGGTIGAAVAKEFAAEGAEVFCLAVPSGVWKH